MKQLIEMTAPWYVQRKKLEAFFELDESVSVGEIAPIVGAGAGEYGVTVSVSNHAKADALAKILRKTYEFSGVTLRVSVVDTADEATPEETFKDAFAHNRMVRGVTHEDANGFERTFIVVEPDILQFRADNLADYRRNVSKLASDVAAELFETDAGVAFCTADLCENGG